MINQHTIQQVRKQLGDHNDDKQPVEWCIQNMRLESERLKKNILEANKEIEALREEIKEIKIMGE